ncbi:uncharacterized protein PFL1_05739 [Pseudozyma flocculosa PF-1]|uniref:Related to Cut9 interacting protein scn1 n=2 Tax=Pseudozyma flocculosa TaxID=84751 RepID=A0A5C3F8Y0_9BASI|nr:uncharacterized protein PFL1_05739 [Pseudozyma flocculosa PF-1]EPQ26760.1 hypothetical protein PFL1_05739 [Pseudozyma flocculosa PF-1]SPO40914.1 related to Cut9 interacting protein scn1 [Pseudozyma flocculosa]
MSNDGANGAADELPSPPPELVHLLVDTHAHPADDPCTYDSSLSAPAAADALKQRLQSCPMATVVAMSTSYRDQPIVQQLASSSLSSSSSSQSPSQDKLLPCFGLHPWFAHTVSLAESPPKDKRQHYLDLFAGQKSAEDEVDEILADLPDPTTLSDLLRRVRQGLESHPTAILGEVGIDRAFRIPRKRWSYDPFSGNATKNNTHTCCSKHADGPNGSLGDDDDDATATARTTKPKLTRLKTPLPHQLAIVRAQISLAVELGRNVSFHSVQASGATLDLMRELHLLHPGGFSLGMRDINVSFHSCTMDVNIVKTLQKTYPNAYIGFSSTINSIKDNHRDVIQTADAKRILVESDFHRVDGMAKRVWEATRIVGEVWAGWSDAELEQKRSDHAAAKQSGQDGETELDVAWRKAAQQLARNWRRFCRNGAVTRDDDDEDNDDDEDDGDDSDED